MSDYSILIVLFYPSEFVSKGIFQLYVLIPLFSDGQIGAGGEGPRPFQGGLARGESPGEDYQQGPACSGMGGKAEAGDQQHLQGDPGVGGQGALPSWSHRVQLPELPGSQADGSGEQSQALSGMQDD